METRCHHVFTPFFSSQKEVTFRLFYHSPKSSICVNFARHSSAFSGLFQAS